MDAARNYLFPLYASLLTPWWLRAARREGRPGHRDLHGAADAEVHRRRGRRVPGRRHHGGVLRARRRLDPRRQGDRSASGRSWATPASPSPAGGCPTTGWSRCCRATPHKAKAGSSWLGSPPIRLRRQPTAADALRTFHPPMRLKIMRGVVETCRLIPVMVTFAIGVGGAGRAAGAGRRVRLAVGGAGRRRGAADRGRRRGRHRGRSRNGLWWAGSGRSNIRCGRRSCGATRCRTPSSRRSPRRGSPAPPAAPR